MANKKIIPIKEVTSKIKKSKPFDCSVCPGYCCTYEIIGVSRDDVKRLALAHQIGIMEAYKQFTHVVEGVRSLKHQKDHIYKSVCHFFDKVKRQCSTYSSRPSVCRDYPIQKTCGYYEFLIFERENQVDPLFIPTL